MISGTTQKQLLAIMAKVGGEDMEDPLVRSTYLVWLNYSSWPFFFFPLSTNLLFMASLNGQ
jgi:hypothetical protein